MQTPENLFKRQTDPSPIIPSPLPLSSIMDEVTPPLSKPLAATACLAMACFYVAILYAPLILRLSPPQDLNHFMIRRFICALISSVTSIIFSALFIPIYWRHNSVLKASMVVGLQLGYTVIFGSYASFLFVRTGHLLAPLFAHIFCNFMGLPVLFDRRKGIVSVAFVAGTISFICLLPPLTKPGLYNDRTTNCKCWHGFCSWI